MLVEIESRIIELLRGNSGVSPLVVENVICYLERDIARLEGRDEFFHYIEYLRNLGIGKDSITVADASMRAWLVDDKFVDLDLVESMLHGCLKPILSNYEIDRTEKKKMASQFAQRCTEREETVGEVSYLEKSSNADGAVGGV